VQRHRVGIAEGLTRFPFGNLLVLDTACTGERAHRYSAYIPKGNLSVCQSLTLLEEIWEYGRNSGIEKVAELFLDNLVALASRQLQDGSIKNGDPAAAVADQA
jgi:hypothetical protein